MTLIKTIYLVDDDEDWRFLIKEAINHIGLQVDVLEADNGLALFEILPQDVNNAVLLLDINMPRMNGIEVLTKLKNTPEWSSLPAILVSSASESDLPFIAQKTGATTFFTKPTEFNEYIELVSKLAAYV